MKLLIDISKDRYDEIMSMDWKNCRLLFDEEIRAIHDGIPQRTERWIPITSRPMTEEEKEDFAERTGYDEKDFDDILSCPLPEDGETVLITDRLGNVEVDTFINDCDGCYFECNCDMEDVKAWMPLPQPYQSENSTGAEGSDKE